MFYNWWQHLLPIMNFQFPFLKSDSDFAIENTTVNTIICFRLVPHT